MAEPKQERDGGSPSDEDDNNQRVSTQRTDSQEGAEQQPNGEEYGYYLETESVVQLSQTVGRDDEDEQEEGLAVLQSTDHQCGGRGAICGMASQLPYLRTTTAYQMAEKKTGQEALSGADTNQLRQAHREREEQQNLQLDNRNNTLEDGNLFPLPGWTEKGHRIQQCTDENPPGGIVVETGHPQEHDCLCETCQGT